MVAGRSDWSYFVSLVGEGVVVLKNGILLARCLLGNTKYAQVPACCFQPLLSLVLLGFVCLSVLGWHGILNFSDMSS